MRLPLETQEPPERGTETRRGRQDREDDQGQSLNMVRELDTGRTLEQEDSEEMDLHCTVRTQQEKHQSPGQESHEDRWRTESGLKLVHV